MNVKAETWEHIHQVQKLLIGMAEQLQQRALEHDQTKLHEPEIGVFEVYTQKLKDTTYGSDEYKQYLKEMKPALDHHYSENRHHPEHFEHGVRDMTLIDLVEMLCDWKAATLRHADGDIYRSLEINAKRFNIPHDLRMHEEIFRVREGNYASKNYYWSSWGITHLIANCGEADRKRFSKRVEALRTTYGEMSAIYQESRYAGADIPLK